MSDPDRQTDPIPPAAGVAPSGGQVLAGFLLILFGLCLFLVGGGCTILWVTILASGSGLNGSESPGLLILSLAAAGGGMIAIWQGVKMLRRKKAGRGDAAGSTGAGTDDARPR